MFDGEEAKLLTKIIKKFHTNFIKDLMSVFSLSSCLTIICFSASASKLNETNISTHVNAQVQALQAIESGVKQLQRSCILSQETTSLSNSLTNLQVTISSDFADIKKHRQKEKEFAINFVEVSKKYNTKFCNLFSTLLNTANPASDCGVSQKAKADSNLILSSVLDLQVIDEKLENIFSEVIDLEAKNCLSTGMSENLYLKHKSFLETIGGGPQDNVILRIDEYIENLREKLN